MVPHRDGLMAELRKINVMEMGSALTTHVPHRSVMFGVGLYTSNVMERTQIPEFAFTDTALRTTWQ